MPVDNGKFYCPRECSGGLHRNARYVAELGYEVSSRTYYRHKNQRRLIGRFSLLTADRDEQPSLLQGSLQTVSSTTRPDTPFNNDEFGSQQQQHAYDDIGDCQNDDEDDAEDEDFADVMADQEGCSDGQSVLSVNDLYGDRELDILDGDLETDDDTNDGTLGHSNSSLPAVQPSPSRIISGTHTSGQPTSESSYSKAFAGSYSKSCIDDVGFRLLGLIPNITAQSLHKCKELIDDCTGLRPIRYDCCHSTPCVCYFGEYEGYQECPKCGAPRFEKHSNKPHKTFSYIPLEPRIRAIFGQKELSKLVQEYPSEIMSKYQNGTLGDFWNGDIVSRLRADCFLHHPTEIALTLSIDGVQLVKSNSHQTWPIMGVIMNIPT
ncbi:hypothetical protein V1506DRAFT_563648 [Lipomyces tetrasporus]